MQSTLRMSESSFTMYVFFSRQLGVFGIPWEMIQSSPTCDFCIVDLSSCISMFVPLQHSNILPQVHAIIDHRQMTTYVYIIILVTVSCVFQLQSDSRKSFFLATFRICNTWFLQEIPGHANQLIYLILLLKVFAEMMVCKSFGYNNFHGHIIWQEQLSVRYHDFLEHFQRCLGILKTWSCLLALWGMLSSGGTSRPWDANDFKPHSVC